MKLLCKFCFRDAKIFDKESNPPIYGFRVYHPFLEMRLSHEKENVKKNVT